MKSFPHEPSKLKKKLVQNKLTIGSWLTIPHQAVIEVMGTAGFEWLTIDIEHTSIGLETAQNLIALIQSNGMEALIRVSSNEEVTIKRIMDAGANGIIVPMIKSGEEAERAVSYLRFPSMGIRGVGLARAQHYGIGFNSYLDWLKTNSILITQIEHIDGVNDIENILRVDGVDGIIIGPYDLSASMGKPGDFNDKEVLEAIEYVKSKTLESKKTLGFHVIDSSHRALQEKIEPNLKL